MVYRVLVYLPAAAAKAYPQAWALLVLALQASAPPAWVWVPLAWVWVPLA